MVYRMRLKVLAGQRAATACDSIPTVSAVDNQNPVPTRTPWKRPTWNLKATGL